ncbi:TonB-dependent receptor [Erythrobacter sp. HA6-11]
MTSTALAVFAVPSVAFAQDEDAAASDEGDAIVVTGIRQTIQNSIEEKRNAIEVFDAISADEIGDLPALSIGEALETLTGAGSHREQGGATEISIRGLGPFLGSTVINGRVATNGSGDRSVNFSQFPSELFSKVGIYKTQAASYVEGGVAGQIVLETVKPLDYGKQRIQGEFKLNYNPDNFDIASDQRLRDFGYRGTLSFVDQFQLGDAELGISLGYQRNRATNPEQENGVSNTIRACVIDPTDTGDGVFDDGNCDTSSDTINGLRDGSVTDDFLIARNSYFYRQNRTDDQRDAFFAAVQFKPSPNVDINADFQYSQRDFQELRSDLVFSEGRRIDGQGDPNRLDFDLIVTDTGALRQFTNESRIESVSHEVERREDYYGGGLSIDVDASDRLRLSADVSYSETERFEEQIEIRMRTRDTLNVFGDDDQWPDGVESDGSTQNDRVEVAYLIRQNGSEIVNFVVQDFDVTNPDLFAGDARARYDLDQARFNSVFGLRGDAEYDMDGFITSVMGGVRYQELEYRASPSQRFQIGYDSDALSAANQECRIDFPESGFLSSVSGGNPLVTNVDASGNVIGTTNSYAAFDARCLAQVMELNDPSGLVLGSDGVPVFPTAAVGTSGNADVVEETWAGYLQANFEGEFGSTPVRGNFGVRIVNTKVDSIGLRTTLSSVTDADTGEVTIIEDSANLVEVSGGGSYTEWLPSMNLVAEFQPDLLGRFAVYRALSRPDPSDLSFGRQFSSINDEDNPQSVEDAIGVVTSTGNPFTDPLMSWNIDAGLEWYPNEDTILAFNAYYKSFNGGFEQVGQLETFVVDGTPVEALVAATQTTDETSTIYGLEITAAHTMTWLPQPLDGLGFKLSYNYADSNFEFEDDTLGEISTLNADGSFTTQNGLIPSANLFGFSKHVLSAQAFYSIGDLDLQGVYKYRSTYFQQFISTPGRIRYTDGFGVFEARLSYQITDNVRFTLEGLNLFGEPRTDFRGAPDDLGQVLAYGPRYFAGIRFKF